jgi:tRNA(Ile)-lysidine synthetase-like protein
MSNVTNNTVGVASYATRSGEARHYIVENLTGPFIIRFRSGGEKIKLPGRPSKTLKSFFQENAIPPWQRARTPLLYDKAGELRAVLLSSCSNALTETAPE